MLIAKFQSIYPHGWSKNISAHKTKQAAFNSIKRAVKRLKDKIIWIADNGLSGEIEDKDGELYAFVIDEI